MYRLASGLAALGHRLDIIAIDQEDIDCSKIDFCNVHKVIVKTHSKKIGALLTLLNSYPYTQQKKDHKAVYQLIDRLIEENKFDIIYTDQSHVAAYGSYIKRKYKIPFVIRYHNLEHEIYQRVANGEKNFLMRKYIALQANRWKNFEVEQTKLSDAGATITLRDKENLLRLVPTAELGVVTASVDTNNFTFSGGNNRTPNSMLMVGSNMSWAPNRDSVVWFAKKILPEIMRLHPETICYLIGEEAPMNELPAPSKNFIFLDKNLDIKNLYSTLSVGVVPLRLGGGMRIKILEMMACGMPIVSTTTGAEGNAAIQHEHYILADEVNDFAEGVALLLKNSELRNKIATEARKFVVANYSAESTVKNFEKILTNVLNKN